MSTNLGSGNSGEGKGEQQSRLPVLEDPNEIRGSYLLIDVFDLNDGASLKRDMIEDLRGSYIRLCGALGMEVEFPPVPADGFMVSVCGGLRYRQISAFREVSEELLEELERGVPAERIRDRARQLIVFYPEFIPAQPAVISRQAETGLESKINSMSRLIGGGGIPGIHIRMPEGLYMYFLKSAFRVLEKKGVDIDRVRIHAMKE
jgi:hypothetical protein